MTGLGLGEVTHNGSTVQVEVKSVNNRFLEVSCRVPTFLSKYERAVREVIRSRVHRGKIYITITLHGENDGSLDISVNRNMVKAVTRLLNELRECAGIAHELTLDHILKFSEVFEPLYEQEESQGVWLHVEKALHLALDDLKKMRSQEGETLARDILQRTAMIDQQLKRIEENAGKNLEMIREKLKSRLQDLMEESVDTDRVYMEIALLTDKMDLTEECVRLKSHNQLFQKTIEKDECVGKRLNFILQEMNREANTISSKACSAEISQIVVFIKEEIEKIREQVQNLE